MLHIQNLRFGYGPTPVLIIPNLSVPAAGSLLLRGPSGSGKSSLLALIAGLLKPQQGTISINGQQVGTLSRRQADAFRGRAIGFVFQQPHLIPALTVLQNVLLAPYMAGIKADKPHALALLKQLGLEGLAGRYPTQLSHGQQQRVGVARALVHKPALVLADEPTSALDDNACEATITLLGQAAKREGAQLVVASHDARITPHFKQTFSLKGARS